MNKIIQAYYARIFIGVSFFLFGFFVISTALDMSLHDIVAGLLAGAIGGAVMLLVSVSNSIELSPALRVRFYGEA